MNSSANPQGMPKEVRMFQSARSNLLLAIIFTAVNIILGLAGTGSYFLFSISFPYYFFDPTDVFFMALSVLVLALYVLCYFLSKKNPILMPVAMSAFILDCLFIAGYSYLLVSSYPAEIGYGDFLLEYLAHIWVLVWLIIGTANTKKYRNYLEDPASFAPVQSGVEMPAPEAASPDEQTPAVRQSEQPAPSDYKEPWEN